MEAISYRFLDWVAARVVQHSEGLLTADAVFDERAQDLGQNVRMAVQKGLGLAVVLSLPVLRHVGEEAAETQYDVSVEVWIFHNKGLSANVDSVLLTEHLFRAFAGAEFALPNSELCANVEADGLQHDVQGVKQTHYFTINYTETI